MPPTSHTTYCCCRDRQPPFVVRNATGAAVDVGFFPPAEAGDGSFAYGAPHAALRASRCCSEFLFASAACCCFWCAFGLLSQFGLSSFTLTAVPPPSAHRWAPGTPWNATLAQEGAATTAARMAAAGCSQTACCPQSAPDALPSPALYCPQFTAEQYGGTSAVHVHASPPRLPGVLLQEGRRQRWGRCQWRRKRLGGSGG